MVQPIEPPHQPPYLFKSTLSTCYNISRTSSPSEALRAKDRADEFINRITFGYDMAKTDSFFIRQSIEVNTAAAGEPFAQEGIDLGAFVDALGRSVLKVKTISVQYADTSDVSQPIAVAANQMNKFAWQLTTQSQSAMLLADDRSLVSSGSLTLGNNTSTADRVTFMNESLDLNPQEWSGGYLIGVDQIYLGAQGHADPPNGSVTITVVMECVSETLSKEAAMALALSQQ